MATELSKAEQKMVQNSLYRKQHQGSMLKYASPIALVLKATLVSDISTSKRFDSNSIQFAKQANRIIKKDGGFKVRTKLNSKLSAPCASVVDALVFGSSPAIIDTVSTIELAESFNLTASDIEALCCGLAISIVINIKLQK